MKFILAADRNFFMSYMYHRRLDPRKFQYLHSIIILMGYRNPEVIQISFDYRFNQEFLDMMHQRIGMGGGTISYDLSWGLPDFIEIEERVLANHVSPSDNLPEFASAYDCSAGQTRYGITQARTADGIPTPKKESKPKTEYITLDEYFPRIKDVLQTITGRD